MIDITVDRFEAILPFVGAASEDVFNKMLESFDDTYQDLVTNIIGQDHENDATMVGSRLLLQVG